MTDRAAALARVRRRRLLMIGAVVALFALPAWSRVHGFWGFVMGWALCSSMVGLSMNVLVGYAGQISLAQAVLFGTGAFTLANLVTFQGLPWLLALPAAGLVTAAISLAIGFPALRIRGLNLAIATLGFQFVMHRIVFRTEFLTRGAAGVDIGPPTILGREFDTVAKPHEFVWVILVVFVLIWVVDRNLVRSRAGRAFQALRQDEQVAASFGIPVARYKLLAFAISGFYAGTAGALFGTLQGEVSGELFDYQISIEFLVFAVLGGLGSRAGTAVGAAFPVLYRQAFTGLANTGAALGGLLLVFTLLRYQGGLAAQGRDLREVGVGAARFGLRGLAVFMASVVSAVVAGLVSGAIVLRLVDAVGPEFRLRELLTGAVGLGAAIVVGDLGRKFSPAILARLAPAAVEEAVRREQEEAEARAAVVRPMPVSPAAFLGGDRHRSMAGDGGTAASLLSVRDLAMHFGGVRALDGVSLEVHAGELVGIMGPNGSGKTTLINCVAGFLTPTRGDVLIRGRSVRRLAAHDRAVLGVARTFQQVGLVKSETVFANFLIAQHNVCRYGPFEGLLRSSAVLAEERYLRARAGAVVDFLDLGAVVGQTVASLPHGQAKLVELGCALVSDPELLLLDEPAAGLGPQDAEALGDRLGTIAGEFGVTIVMIEHHVPLMLSTCDYIYVLDYGQLLAEGTPLDVARNPEVITAYLGGTLAEADYAAAGSR